MDFYPADVFVSVSRINGFVIHAHCAIPMAQDISNTVGLCLEYILIARIKFYINILLITDAITVLDSGKCYGKAFQLHPCDKCILLGYR